MFRISNLEVEPKYKHGSFRQLELFLSLDQFQKKPNVKWIYIQACSLYSKFIINLFSVCFRQFYNFRCFRVPKFLLSRKSWPFWLLGFSLSKLLVKVLSTPFKQFWFNLRGQLGRDGLNQGPPDKIIGQPVLENNEIERFWREIESFLRKGWNKIQSDG